MKDNINIEEIINQMQNNKIKTNFYVYMQNALYIELIDII